MVANASTDTEASSPILVVCESNSAVDNLLQLLDDLNVTGLLRVVNNQQSVDRPLSAIAKSFSLAERLKEHRGESRRTALRSVLRKASVVLATNSTDLVPSFCC